MKRQRNMSHMKEQEKSSGKELNEMKARNLLAIEFKAMVIRILNSMKGHRNHKRPFRNEEYSI